MREFYNPILEIQLDMKSVYVVLRGKHKQVSMKVNAVDCRRIEDDLGLLQPTAAP
jgi:hypothetical protein